MLQRFLPLWLLILSGCALWWPRMGLGFDPFLEFDALHAQALSLIFALAMFGIGSLLPADEVRQVFRQWPRVFLGTLAQYSLMPFLGWLVAISLEASPGTKIGFILAGTVPGAMASNILTLQARGNVSYSVSLTTVSTILSPLVVPTVLMFALSSVVSVEDLDVSQYFDPVKTGIKLAWSVALPVVAGHLLTRFSTTARQFARRFSEPAANLIILWIIAVIVAKTRSDFEFSGVIIIALLALNLIGYLAGYSVGRLAGLDEPMRRALVLEVGMQNAGLGSLLAVKIFPDHPEAAVPTVLYMFGCMLTGTLLARYWNTQEPLPKAINGFGEPTA
ncbi:MAG: bile acid:sodium symporter family protein [Planctomycetaceae bacterium]|nr:bile acid:sodium symporter family protein [Planctomycetaceae bacterium]